MLVFNYWMSSLIGFILLQLIVGVCMFVKRANKAMRGLVFSILFTFWMLVNLVFLYLFAGLSVSLWLSLSFVFAGSLLITYYMKRWSKGKIAESR